MAIFFLSRCQICKGRIIFHLGRVIDLSAASSWYLWRENFKLWSEYILNIYNVWSIPFPDFILNKQRIQVNIVDWAALERLYSAPKLEKCGRILLLLLMNWLTLIYIYIAVKRKCSAFRNEEVNPYTRVWNIFNPSCLRSSLIESWNPANHKKGFFI